MPYISNLNVIYSYLRTNKQINIEKLLAKLKLFEKQNQYQISSFILITIKLLKIEEVNKHEELTFHTTYNFTILYVLFSESK
jgi:hypothetical protein